jgi:hypothetical protein
VKLWGPKVAKVLTLTILGLPFGTPGTKCHLDVGLMERHKVCYKREGGGFSQVRALVNLVSPSCLWFVLTPKVLQLCINHLLLVLCRPVWVNEACQFFLVPSQAPARPFTLPKCYEPGSMLRLLVFLLFSIWDSHLSPSRSWECIRKVTLLTTYLFIFHFMKKIVVLVLRQNYSFKKI